MRDLVAACVVQLWKLQLQRCVCHSQQCVGEPQHVVRQLWQGTSEINTHTQQCSTAGTAGSPQAKAWAVLLSITIVLPKVLRQCVKAVAAFDVHWPSTAKSHDPLPTGAKNLSYVRSRLSASRTGCLSQALQSLKQLAHCSTNWDACHPTATAMPAKG